MTEQSKHPQLHTYMSNLLASGARHERVRKQGEKFAVALIYGETTQALREGPVAIVTAMHESTILLRASEMVLAVCDEVGISTRAIKERIGR